MSGYQKSQINNIRYSLHQMTRETDHTQALMDFIRLAFQAVRKKDLLGMCRKTIYHLEGKKQVKYEYEKGEMSRFLEKFKVKRQVLSCIREYTKDSFFHEILNIGLRVFQTPNQLIYLRLAFSHMFWSIKLLYYRHKREIVEEKKKEEKIVTLYRGCSVTDEEVKALKMNEGGYIQAEGFLSTSMLESVTQKFKKNLLMRIEVPEINLKGMLDNGFADISLASSFSAEKEVLFNACNIFKVLSFRKAKKDEQAHILHLQYGSIKAVSKKVKKSEELLDKEYLWNIDYKQISLIKRKLKVNEERMTEHWHSKLTNILLPEEQRLWKRKTKLKEQAKEEYQEAVKKLGQWDKELLINIKYQQQQMASIEDYGQLLFRRNENEKACTYLRKRMEQMQLDMAVEGLYWRNNEFFTYKLQQSKFVLAILYYFVGRIEEAFFQLEQLLNVYRSINIQQSNPQYYFLLLLVWMMNRQYNGEGNKYKEQILRVINTYQLTNTDLHKLMISLDKIEKNEEKMLKRVEEKGKKNKKVSRAERKKASKQQKRIHAEKKQQLKQMRQQLYNVRIYTSGIYSLRYLRSLYKMVLMLKLWGLEKLMFKQGIRYLQIRDRVPHIEHRMCTCSIFRWMLDACLKRYRHKLPLVCRYLASFMTYSIHNYQEYQIVLKSITACLKLQCWKASKPVLLKLMKTTIKCELSQRHLVSTLNGYVLLLLSTQSTIDNFLRWMNAFLIQQQKTNTLQQKKVLQWILKYNDTYNKSNKDVYASRKKECQDTLVIEGVKLRIKNEGKEMKKYIWEEKREELTPWHHPFYDLFSNWKESRIGLQDYLARGCMNMVIQHCLQQKNMHYNIFDDCETYQYLTIVSSISKLHMIRHSWNRILQLLLFYSDRVEVGMVQIWEMGLDLEKGVEMVEHLQQQKKGKVMQEVKVLVNQLMKRRKTVPKKFGMEVMEVKYMRHIYRRYKRFKVLSATIPFRRTSNLTL